VPWGCERTALDGCEEGITPYLARHDVRFLRGCPNPSPKAAPCPYLVEGASSEVGRFGPRSSDLPACYPLTSLSELGMDSDTACRLFGPSPYPQGRQPESPPVAVRPQPRRGDAFLWGYVLRAETRAAGESTEALGASSRAQTTAERLAV
jgi:hypothetical protein